MMTDIPATSTSGHPPRPEQTPKSRRSIFPFRPFRHQQPSPKQQPQSPSQVSPTGVNEIMNIPCTPSTRKACLSPHHHPVNEYTSLPTDQLMLPALPRPLQKTPSGVYPMEAAKPVLRKESSSYQGSFNLTQTMKHLSYQPSMESSDASSTHSRKVSFDPRITITEFDDKCPRQWYSEYELEDMKLETIRLARMYLTEHPELIPQYNEPISDPITGISRKRALFSLPGLSHEVEQIQPCTIQAILIVDKNQTILDLFSKSLKQMLGTKTKIRTVTTGEEAIRLMSNNNYDIIICEHRLKRINNSLRKGLSEAKLQTPHHAKNNSWHLTENGEEQWIGMTGCEIFELAQNQCPTTLLIGVSAHLEEDTQALTQSGADLVWGKPPPRMDEALKDLLQMKLQEKQL